MKRKSLTMILCLLTCLSLVGVGFASWVISSGDTEVATGNITVDAVSDQRFYFGNTETLKSIHFGMANVEEISNAWLTNQSATKENLSATFEIVLNSKAELDGATEAYWKSVVEVTANFALAEVGETTNSKNSQTAVDAYNDAKKAKAIIVPNADLTVKFLADKSTTTYATYQVVVEFAWGEAFDTERTNYRTSENFEITDDYNPKDNLNPYVFYNSKDVKNWGDDAYYYLHLIELIESLYYNVTVTATSK